MNKLTAEKCRHHIDRLSDGGEQRCLSIYEEDYLQALEIALPVLEQEEGFTELSEISPYDVQHTMPESLVGLISEGIGITFDEDDAQAIWNVCRLEMMKVHQPASTPQIDNDGWIEWRGGKQPIANDRELAIKFRDGTVMTETHSDCWVWSHGGDDDDIIAYRVIENDGREG
ncbi:hypothetical protein QMZ65_03135 [Pantoea sp. EABMAA-21]|uniref:hypothetical protein n=1 Tax=Pantoea sp. EABMAA-21 TaxID=3043302 RepID=UPI0024B5F5F6|nr:hypothetical protein [Pantoea sp. EABMAA-21]MDI9276199.1 hypothetical protein [Pantoea sp. EABMAA-21]